MNERLGKKQRIKNEDWISTLKNIEKAVSRERIDALAEDTIERVRKTTLGKRVAYAWSGGKDSLVLGDIARKAGIIPCVLVISNLEYQAFTEWVEAHKPPELTIINTGQDMKWLAEHQEMLFPQDSRYASRWFKIVQHRGQDQYYKDKKLDMILLGRRKADGNYVGKGNNIYTNIRGITRYSPLSDWSHEEILAYIHYNNLAMPPIYDWDNGFLCGTHPWPARQWTESIEKAWEEVFKIDSSIVLDAAEYFESARVFLDNL